MKNSPVGCLMLFFVWSINSDGVLAADDIVLRSAVTPEEAWVGEKLVLQVDVLAKDAWAQLRRVTDIEVDGAYLLHLESQGTRLNETIGGVSYTGQRYSFLLFAQREGKLVIPSVPVDVEVKSWGGDGGSRIERKVLPSVIFFARMPPGAENTKGLISTRSLTATQSWDSDMESPLVGDAIKRSVVLRAEDISGMAFSPSPHKSIEDVGIYPGEPTVQDSFNRGELVGTRTETVTYVFERAGQVEIPEVELTWWNVETEELRQIVLPGLSLEVAGGPVTQLAEPVAAQQQDKRLLWLSFAGTVLAVIALLFFNRRAVAAWEAWRKTRNETEAACFRRIRRSVRSGDSADVLRDTMRWLDYINDSSQPARLDLFLRRFGDSDSTVSLLSESKPGIRAFHHRLIVARNRWQRSQTKDVKSRELLPNLNI